MTPTRIAVIIPCYRDGDFVAEAVDSLRGNEQLEIVVVDDGSDDLRTLEVLEGLEHTGTRVVREEQNRGCAAARTRGLRETRARFVFPLDADDLAIPASLSAMADLLDASPTKSVCFGDYAEVSREGSEMLVRAVPTWLDPYRIAYTNEYPVSALFRRSAVEAAGGWHEVVDRFGYEDWGLWMALAEAGAEGAHLGPGRLTYRRRMHGGRLLGRARERHRTRVLALRRRHPALFDDIGAHRARSDLALLRKLLYPIVYAPRRLFAWEFRVKAQMDRFGVWTLTRR